MSKPATVPIGATPAPRVSVAMCTYNGAAYVKAQLASILAQERAVDEIIVSDDGSSDDTLARVGRVLDGGQVPWRLLTGQRLGITQNFARAVTACTGDVIFLCDQDDVWRTHKVGTLLALLQAHPDCDLVFSNARLVDAEQRDLGRSQFDVVRLRSSMRATLAGPRAFETLLRRNVVTGATVAFRRRLLGDALPFVDGWLHDDWLAIVAAARGPLLACADPLVLYRQHGRNQCGMSAEPLAQQIATVLSVRRQRVGVKRMSALAERMERLSREVGQDRRRFVAAALAFQRRRDELPASRLLRILRIGTLAAGGGYMRFDAGWRAIAKDALGRA